MQSTFYCSNVLPHALISSYNVFFLSFGFYALRCNMKCIKGNNWCAAHFASSTNMLQLIRQKFISCAQFFNQPTGDVRCTFDLITHCVVHILHGTTMEKMWRKRESEKDQKFAIGRQRNAKEVGPAKC